MSHFFDRAATGPSGRVSGRAPVFSGPTIWSSGSSLHISQFNTYICMYIYMYVYVVNMYIYICTFTHTHYICACMYVYIFMYTRPDEVVRLGTASCWVIVMGPAATFGVEFPLLILS